MKKKLKDKMRKKLICFDMDNTLIYSDKAHAIAFNKALKDLNLRERKLKELIKHFGKPKIEVAKIIAPKANKSTLKKILSLHDCYLYKETKKYTKIIPGVREAIKKLKNNYKIALLTNCDHSNIKILLKAAKLNYKLFDILIGYDDVKKSKPYPNEILRAEKLLKHKADYMVGDSIYDIKAGKRAKVKTIAVLTGNYSKNILKKEKPDLIIKSVKYLPKYLK